MAVSIDTHHAPRLSPEEYALALAIERYLESPRNVTVRDLSRIRAYCVRWISKPVWNENPHSSRHWGAELAELRAAARRIASPEMLAQWIAEANRCGLDPLL